MSKKTNLNSWLVSPLLLLGIVCSTAGGGVIYVDGDGPVGGDGSSWAKAYNYLQDALNKPPSSGDEIRVARGIYKPDQDSGNPSGSGDRTATFNLVNGVGIYGGYAGYGEPDPDARDIDWYETILSGDIGVADVNRDNTYNVVTGSGTDETAVLDGFTIRAANANGGGIPYNEGGGMNNTVGSPTVSNCLFSKNWAERGGGMCNVQGSHPVVSHCTFIENTAGMNAGAMQNTDSSPTLIDCTFGGNRAPYAGGLYTSNGGNMTLTDCTFSGNSAAFIGGGIYCFRSNPTLTNCIFNGNSATNFGGGMYNYDDSNPMMIGCTFNDNSAEFGGGLYNHNNCSPTLTDCTFSANWTTNREGGAMYNQNNETILTKCGFYENSSATQGGGIYNFSSSLILTNCIFSGNTAPGNGGGMSNYGGSNPILTNCTFSANSAGSVGGGIINFTGDSPTVLNCILWGNSDVGGSDESAQMHGGSPTVTYTCVQGLDTFSGGTGNIGNDPCFVDVNGPDDIIGTEDDNLRLSYGSPCIDTGHPGPQYQDPDGTRNDMGAYGGPYGDVSGAGSHVGTGFVFTSIGNIPTSEIVRDACSPSHGLVDVNSVMAAELGIPQYKDSPLGGTLWIHGLFGDNDDVDYYQILAGKWVDGNEPEPNDFVALKDSLTKVEYYIDPCTSTWTYRYVTLGPKTIDGKDNLYQLTDEGYWSHIDLRARWNTTAYENGKYTLTYEAYRWADPCQTTLVDANLSSTGWDYPTLIVDNSPVTAIIHSVKYDPCSPYYDDPCDGQIPECAIINLTDANENLRFAITAWHPTGYLRSYVLDTLYGKNRYGGVIASDSYSPPPSPYWNGVEEKEFQSKDSGSLDPWQQCAYQFRLRVYSRTTNGYYYIISKGFSDHYFLDLGLASCCGADIDRSGAVDFKDLARLAKHWLETCEP